MLDIKHHAIVVTSEDSLNLLKMWKWAASKGFQVIGPSTPSGPHGFMSFMVCPDGGIHGSEESRPFDVKREEFILLLKRHHLEWVAVQFGTSDWSASITSHAWDDSSSP